MEQQINLNKNVTIEFTPQQISIVFAVLKKQTYEQVCDVIGSIESQILKQVNITVPSNGVTVPQ